MARGNYDLKFLLIDGDFFDKEKIFLIEEKYGIEGGYIAIRLLLWIAGKGGYGAEWNDKTSPRYFAVKALGDKSKSDLVAEIVSDLFEIGFFDRAALTESGLLTSPEIVKDWLRAYKQFYKREAPTDGLPEYVVKVITKTAANAEGIAEESPKHSGDFGEISEDCGANAAQLRRNCGATAEETAANAEKRGKIAPQKAAKSPLEKKRKEYNIYNSPSTRARTREGAPPADETADKTYTAEERAQAEKMISLWNEITKGTDREFTDFYPPEILISRIIDRIRQEPKEEIWRRVFTNARNEPFPWTLPAVFNKPDNFNQLKITIQKTKEKATAGRADRFGSDRPRFGKADYYD